MKSILPLLLLPSLTFATERDISIPWCINEMGGFAEVVLYDNTRVDCETATHAWEVGFACKWDDLNQALHYGRLLGKKPGIAVIVQSDKDKDCVYRLSEDMREFGISVPDIVIIDRRP